MYESVVQSLWIGDQLSNLEILSINSFIKHGHQYHLYVYEIPENLPANVILKDASKILSKAEVFEDREIKNSYAGYSNIFRYKLLLENGGFWVDTDIICLKKFDFKQNYVFALQRDSDGIDKVNGGVMKVPSNSEFAKYCLELSVEKAKTKYRWGHLGPILLFEAVNKFDLSHFSKPYYVFNPIDWMDFNDIINDNEFIKRIKLNLKLFFYSYSVHIWNSIWNRRNLNKNMDYPQNSLYEYLKRKYL